MAVNAIADISHHSGSVDLNGTAQSGLVAVIRKATQGTNFQDPMYDNDKDKASLVSIGS